MMKIRPRYLRWILNFYPPYIGAGVHVHKISEDWKRTEVSMNLRWYNRNALNVHFGGSLYSMVDPHLVLMLMGLLGDDYFVMDKSAQIVFVRPGKGRVSATLVIPDQVLEEILTTLETERKVMPKFSVDIMDSKDQLVARVSKTLYVRKKR